nr:MAG: hypothetical protein [Bacteriophage sp.]
MCHGSLYDPYGHHIGFVNNFYTKLGSAQMNLELEDGRTFQFNPGDLLRDRQGDWRIRKREESAFDSMRYMHWANCVMEEATKKKEETNMTAASIKNAIFAPPATIVYWSDGSKTVVKCSEKDVFDPEKGLAMAIAKRCGGNKGSYYKEIQSWVEKSGKKYPGKPTAGKAVDLDVLKKYSSEANKDFEKFLSAVMSNNQSGTLLHLTALVADLKILENEFNK